LLSRSTGIPIRIVPYCDHEEVLKLFGRARVSISLNISDGTPNVVFEAMAMGAFPIQSSTSGAEDFVRNGETGLLVPPEDPQAIAKAIRRAITDDVLVDRDSEINAGVVKERLDQSVIKPKVIAKYEKVATQGPLKRGRR